MLLFDCVEEFGECDVPPTQHHHRRFGWLAGTGLLLTAAAAVIVVAAAVVALQPAGHSDGGGGLIGGIGAYLKTFSPRTKVRGVWAINSPVMHECMRANKIIDVAEKETLSDGTAGGIEEGSITLDVCK